MSRVHIQYLLDRIKDQAEKRHYLNALSWCTELQKWLLGSFNDILKEVREDGEDL